MNARHIEAQLALKTFWMAPIASFFIMIISLYSFLKIIKI